MPTVNGIPVNFGFSGSKGSDGSQGISITGVTGTLLQTADQTKVADKEEIKDGNGNAVVHIWTNLHDEANLEWVVAGTGLANTTANTTLANVEPGDFIVITACASMPTLIGTCWEVQSGAKISKSNTSAAKISCSIHQLSGITGAAAA